LFDFYIGKCSIKDWLKINQNLILSARGWQWLETAETPQAATLGDCTCVLSSCPELWCWQWQEASEGLFKKLAQTCQQHGQDTFIHQVSCRLQTLMTLRQESQECKLRIFKPS
jgi:hypothetical protein